MKRSAVARTDQARSVVAELSNLYRKRKEDKRKMETSMKRKEMRKLKKQKNRHDLSKESGPVLLNKQLVNGFFAAIKVSSFSTDLLIDDESQEDTPKTQ